ncbi:hypothetical protein ACOSP7_022621 [Xanthoceras sorbifolium]
MTSQIDPSGDASSVATTSTVFASSQKSTQPTTLPILEEVFEVLQIKDQEEGLKEEIPHLNISSNRWRAARKMIESHHRPNSQLGNTSRFTNQMQ